MNATNFNTAVTIISIVCTLVSIVCTVVAWRKAKETKKFRDEILGKLDAFDLFSFAMKIHELNNEVSSISTTGNWNKGGNNTLNKLSTTLHDYNIYENKIPNAKRGQLRKSVNKLIDFVDKFNNGCNDTEELKSLKNSLNSFDSKFYGIISDLKNQQI